MNLKVKYVSIADQENPGKRLHKIKFTAGGSPFISVHSYFTKASAISAAKRLNKKLGEN